MFLIGQEINIFNPVIFDAIKSRDGSLIRGEVKRILESKVDALEVNLGGWQGSEHCFPWLLRQIRAVTDRPLFISPVRGILKEAVEISGPNTTINCITADERQLESMLSAAKCLKCNLVVLLTRKGFNPSSLDEICFLAEEVIERAEKSSFPLERLILDPVLRPRICIDPLGDIQNHPDVTFFAEAIYLIGALRKKRIKTISAISNLSTGLTPSGRKFFELSALRIFKMAGLDMVILRAKDKEFVEMARENHDIQLTFKPFHLDLDNSLRV